MMATAEEIIRSVLASINTPGPLRTPERIIQALSDAGKVIVDIETIEQYGTMGNVCVFGDTGRICPGCHCPRKGGER
jgi:hypothetical protein